METFYVKVSLKCKNKRNLCIFFVPYHDASSLFLIQGSYLNKKLRKTPIMVIKSQFLADFVNFDNICHVILKKAFSFGSNCLSKQTEKRY